MKKIMCLVLTLVAFFVDASIAEIFFFDGFESSDLSTTNSDGFSWIYMEHDTPIVTQHPINGNTELYPDVIIHNDGRDWTAKTDNNSLGFFYHAGEPWTEIRYDLGVPQTELWIGYWIRVPENYTHTTTDPPLNNKFFSLWMDGYELNGEGSTFWLSMESAGGGDTNLSFTYTTGNNTNSVSMQQYTPFIDASEDRLRWMRIVIHLKAESYEDANNGIIETWRKWEGETYVKFHEKFDAPLRIPDSVEGFKKGYILGWANAEYLQDTEWLVDDFTLSTTSLLSQQLTLGSGTKNLDLTGTPTKQIVFH